MRKAWVRAVTGVEMRLGEPGRQQEGNGDGQQAASDRGVEQALDKVARFGCAELLIEVQNGVPHRPASTVTRYIDGLITSAQCIQFGRRLVLKQLGEVVVQLIAVADVEEYTDFVFAGPLVEQQIVLPSHLPLHRLLHNAFDELHFFPAWTVWKPRASIGHRDDQRLPAVRVRVGLAQLPGDEIGHFAAELAAISVQLVQRRIVSDADAERNGKQNQQDKRPQKTPVQRHHSSFATNR